jgi:hypothetical protein
MSRRGRFGFFGAFAVVFALFAVWPALASADIYWAGGFSGNGIGHDTIDGNQGNLNQNFIPAADTSVPLGGRRPGILAASEWDDGGVG